VQDMFQLLKSYNMLWLVPVCCAVHQKLLKFAL